MTKIHTLEAGAAFTNITPKTPCFLFGYPFVERISEGVNDWLLCSALYLSDGREEVILISNDVIYVSKATVARVRSRVSEQTGVPASHILIAATHTHSGPVTVDCLSSANDPVVPKTDLQYLRYWEARMIQTACEAKARAVPAKASWTKADATGVGTNRRNPAGASAMEVPVLAVKTVEDEWIACLLVCNMHPTVLHEDSKLYSGDFPAFTREILQKQYFGCECPVLYFTGAAGNQSPRHVTKSNTFEEARRLGAIVAHAAGASIGNIADFHSQWPVSCRQAFAELPRRKFPPVEWAEANRRRALERFEHLRDTSVNRQEIRTAEVDWFGAEELLYLSKQAASGVMEKIYPACMPAEIQVVRIGERSLASWPGEIFVEYALSLREKHPDAFLITLANGDLQGYMVTEEAEKGNYYEASNSLFHYSGGELLLSETLKLLNG
jgi:hypothetical protein